MFGIAHLTKAGALVQWLKLLLGKAEIAGSSPTQAFKFQRKHILSSPLTRKDSILSGASVTER